MGAITIRNLNDETQQGLRELAAENGRSMEAEVRAILDAEVARRQWLSEEERGMLSPVQQTALTRLRKAFRATKERTDHSHVDAFLRERRQMWGDT
ncbi:MAG: hypothetical protein IT548_15720 [Alphaproteobacteria bacterium]|nr:hypothetical protein [Alphaproteobacteria bacterium]